MGSHRILLVEDDRDIRETLAEVLEDEGYKVTCVSNGLEALDALSSPEVPCLILLDLMMPVMDGYAFRAQQKKNPQWSEIPVVAITAANPLQAQSLDVKELVVKPLNLNKLMSALQQHC